MKIAKICTKCYQEKPLCEFNNGKIYNDGKTPSCKDCIKKAKQKYYLKNKDDIKKAVKDYSSKNKTKMLENKKLYYLKNKIAISAKSKVYNQKNKEENKKRFKNWYKNNKERCKKNYKEWVKNNRDKQKIIKQRYFKKKMETDPLFKLTENVRSMISNSLAKNGYTKKSRTQTILGCSFEEFKRHIESKWESWMSWDNRGKYNGGFNYGWDIDHITPLASAKTEEDLIKLNHYTNLRPLCSKVNRDIKKDKLIL